MLESEFWGETGGLLRPASAGLLKGVVAGWFCTSLLAARATFLTNVYFWTCFHPKKAVLLGRTRGMEVTLFCTNTQQESVAASSTFLQELAISCRVRDPASCNLTCKCWRINGK